MKCKQGDMAVIIKSNPSFLGWVVTCVRLLPPGSTITYVTGGTAIAPDFPVWITDRKGLRGCSLAVPDKHLMPIRPLSEGETERKENEVTA